MAAHPNADPRYSRPVSVINRYVDRLAEQVSVNASTDFETLLGAALLATDAAITVISDGSSVRYNCDGTAADATNALLPAQYTIHGGKDVLDNVRLFTGVATNVQIIVHKVVED